MPAGPEHAMDLAEGAPPPGDVVEDLELEDRVVGHVRRIDALGVAGPEPEVHTPGSLEIRESLAGAGDLHLIEVEGVDRRRVEETLDLAHAVALAAADLEYPLDDRRAGRVAEPAE